MTMTMMNVSVGRNLIALSLSDKMPRLLVMMDREMEESRDTLNTFRRKIKTEGRPSSIKNMPLLSSQLKFIQELRRKIMTNIRLFKSLKHPIIYSAESQRLWVKYDSLKELLGSYQTEIHQDWLARAEEKTLRGVKTPLLVRDVNTGTLRVNFDRDTMEILTDVRYIKREEKALEVPESVMEIFKHFDHFKNVHNILSDVTEHYNYLKTNVTDIEFKLIEEEVQEIDTILRPAEKTFHWMSPDTDTYARDLLSVVSEINQRMKDAQDNVIAIYKEVSKWETIPLFTGLKLPLDLEVKAERRDERYEGLRTAARRTEKLIQQNVNIFGLDLQSRLTARRWKNYLLYVDAIVRDSLTQTVGTRKHFTVTERIYTLEIRFLGGRRPQF